MQENQHHPAKKSLECVPEVPGLVCKLVVEQGASVLVGAAAQVADVRPLIRLHVI